MHDSYVEQGWFFLAKRYGEIIYFSIPTILYMGNNINIFKRIQTCKKSIQIINTCHLFQIVNTLINKTHICHLIVFINLISSTRKIETKKRKNNQNVLLHSLISCSYPSRREDCSLRSKNKQEENEVFVSIFFLLFLHLNIQKKKKKGSQLSIRVRRKKFQL